MTRLSDFDPNELWRMLQKMQREIDYLKMRLVGYNQASEVTADLGTMRAGRLYMLTAGSEPEDSDATGMVWSADPITHSGNEWNGLGLNNGNLELGFSAVDGSLRFSGGDGTINSLGITMEGFTKLFKVHADQDGVEREAMFGMIMPPYGEAPLTMLQHAIPESGSELVSNGGFDTDLTGWGGGDVFVPAWVDGYASLAAPGGGENDLGNTSAITVTAGAIYKFSARIQLDVPYGYGRAKVRWTNSSSKVISEEVLFYSGISTTGWKTFEKTVIAPVGAVGAWLTFLVHDDAASCEMDVDDVSLKAQSWFSRLMLGQGIYHDMPTGTAALRKVRSTVYRPRGSFSGTMQAGGNLDPLAAYGYVVTFGHELGETEQSLYTLEVMTTSTNKKTSLSVPVDPTGLAVRRLIYRTEGVWSGNGADPNKFYLVAVIEDNTTTTYVDDKADSELDTSRPAPVANTMVWTGRQPYCSVKRTANQSVARVTDVAVSWQAEISDPYGMWSDSEPTYIWIPVSGRYVITFEAQLAAVGTGSRSAWVEVNGSSQYGRSGGMNLSAATGYIASAAMIDLVAGDYLRLFVRHNADTSPINLLYGTIHPRLDVSLIEYAA
jgi:hypothetical protein